MKLILKQNVTHLGEPGDVVEVADGYGRNYLLPKDLAVVATPASLRLIEQQMTKLTAKSEEMRLAAEAIAEQIGALRLTMERKAAEEDTLYGSVSVADVAEALDERGFEVEKGNIHLEHPIKKVGEFEIPIALAHGVTGTVKVVVVPEADGAEEPVVVVPEVDAAEEPVVVVPEADAAEEAVVVEPEADAVEEAVVVEPEADPAEEAAEA